MTLEDLILQKRMELIAMRGALNELECWQQQATHYKRVLVQAVLTHGGSLTVDTKHAKEAVAYQGELFIGGGLVTLYTPEGAKDA